MNKSRKREDRRAPSLDPEDAHQTPRSGKEVVNEKIAELSVRGVFDATKLSKVKKQSAKQKKRQQAAKERADNLKEVLEKKVSEAVTRHKQVLERKKPWEVLDNELEKRKNADK